ncbi:ABC transporter permease [Chryseolinea sp. T2]|uniref:ABC transporter permease n=1 Tax=Chryseolinea sp. T2 TaxID=3129255 RepID=UPI0030772D01
MLKHNLLAIFRGLRRSKTTLVINLLGLSCSLTVALLIYLWANDELMHDKVYTDHERIYQVLENKLEGGATNTTSNTPEFLAAALLDEMPEIDLASVATPANFFPAFTISDSKHHVKANGKFADPDFIQIFGFPLLEGSAHEVLKERNAIVITESLARKVFGHSPAVGKILEWDVMGTKRSVTVTGVLKDHPSNISEPFDFLTTFDSFREIMGMQNSVRNWDNTAPFATYLKIGGETNVDNLNKKVQALLASKTKNSPNRTFFLNAYADKYLHGRFENGVQNGGRISYVISFIGIAFFILLIACINFTNLATAKAMTRAKSSGIRKVIGARKINLMSLHFLEAMLITFISIIIGLVFVQLLLPQFNIIAEKQLKLVFDQRLVLGIVIIFIVTSVMAGAYPAFHLSGFNPVRVLKGQFSTSRSGLYAKKGLVVFQFVMTMAFILGVVIVHKQIQFISTKDLGYNKEHVIHFEADGLVSQKVESFLSEVRNIPGVVSASGMLASMLSGDGVSGSADAATWEGKVVPWTNLTVNHDLLELLDIKLLQGRSFSRNFNDNDKIILNKSAVDALGMSDPIGKVIGGKEIIGVVRNFHFQSMHEEVKPLSFRLEPGATTTIMIRYEANDEQKTIDRIKTFYSTFNPGYTFTYSHLEDDVQAQHAAENKVSIMSRYAALLAIVISCLGLFGLVSFTTATRSKEISIRKILGSDELGIVMLLSGDFIKTVLIAVIIATPVSYLIAQNWLNSFAYKIELKYSYLFIAAVTTIIIAMLTVSVQAMKSAVANPAANLKSE